MSFFVDANIPVHAATRGPLASACQRVMHGVAGGAAGRISAAALEEVWHLELSGRVEGLAGLADRLLSVFSPLLSVTEEVVRVALSLETLAIGANDRIHVATCIANGIDVIVSADSAFDQVEEIRRVDPLDDAAVGGLLESPGVQ